MRYKAQHRQGIAVILLAQDPAIGIGQRTDPHAVAFNFGTAHHFLESDVAVIPYIRPGQLAQFSVFFQ